MWWEVSIAGMGEEVELKPIGETWRWGRDTFVKVDEAPREIVTAQGVLQLNFVDTSGPQELPEEQTIYYGKYAVKDLASGKTIYLDFRDADYPYGSGTINIVGKWESFEADAVYKIWNWHGNAKEPNQAPFGL
jgi:hypothetical protein